MKVRFLTPAEIEMFEAAAYYEQHASGLGGNFLDIIEAAIDEIADNPKIWSEVGNGIRRRIVRRFPYSVFYQLDENQIIIVAVMHHKQRPRYWINRLER